MYTRIRFARGTNSAIKGNSEISIVGHPIYNKDTKYLYIGDGSTTIKSNTPITTNKIVGWSTATPGSAEFNTPHYAFNADGSCYIATKDDFKIYGDSSKTSLLATYNNTSISFTKPISSAGNITAPTFIGNLTGNADTANYYITNNATLTNNTTALQPFTWYKSNGSISSLNISTFLPSGITGVQDEWFLKFTTTSAPSITLNNISYANGWTASDFEANATYTIYIVDGVAYVSFV